MDKKIFRQLLKAQQGELDAVLMYQALAFRFSDSPKSQTFLQLAADEGRHGAILKEYTGQVLKPRRTKAVLLPLLFSILGADRTLKLMAKGETQAAPPYEALSEEFDKLASIAKDELRHADILTSMIPF